MLIILRAPVIVCGASLALGVDGFSAAYALDMAVGALKLRT